MKYLIKSILLTILISLVFSCCYSCSEEREEKIKKSETSSFLIKESDLKQDFKKNKQQITIPIETELSNEQWNIESSENWCLVSKEIGNKKGIVILVKESTEVDVRTANIKVKTSKKIYNIVVRQLGYGPAILIDKSEITLQANNTNINFKVTSNIEYKITHTAANWISAITTRSMTEKTLAFSLTKNTTYKDRQVTITFTGSEYKNIIAKLVVTQETERIDETNTSVNTDTKFYPTSATASEAQPGSEISYSFDKIIGGNKCYHSIWQQSANFPVTLEYQFDGKNTLDYIQYYTRSGNGNFGKFELFTSTTENPSYKLQGAYDFKKRNASSKILLNHSIKHLTKAKFVIYSGLNNFVSCDEMEFLTSSNNDILNTKLLTVFTDTSCSTLKSGITDEEINLLPPYFANLAYKIKTNSYSEWEKDFRIRNYAPYSNIDIWAENLMTKRYSNLDNPTGIYGEAGETIIVLVGDTHGHSISLQGIKAVEPSGSEYPLKEGVNKIKLRTKAHLFIMYTNNPSEPSIKIHIPEGSGTVNGFFDLDEHKTNAQYKELLDKSTYKYFFVRGHKMMFNFHRSKLIEFVPNKILSAINLWDNIVGWEQELTGIENLRPSQVNNHMCAVSVEEGYMWASDYRVAFIYTYLGNVLLKENVMLKKDNAWGPAHEIGHVHQKAINWPSSTESSNNLFSNYIIYKLGKYCSRGTELSELALNRCILKQGWYNMGDATHMNEDTEIHMRMNWQLWNYYHRCGYQPNFWQTLFKLMRKNRIPISDPGKKQLMFAKMASKAANQDLTDFFDMWGFFVPADHITYKQYGTYEYNITSDMITEAKEYMAKFPKPKHAFYYLEDRKNGDVGIGNYKVGDVGYYTQFKDNQKITKNVYYKLSGRTMSITNGSEAVAFELIKDSNLVYFSNFFSFDIPIQVPITNLVCYAVQADGKRIKMIRK